jgi:hypothetical protein
MRRWSVSDPLGRRLTFVVRASATAEDRRAALSAPAAAQMIESLFRKTWSTEKPPAELLALADISSDARRSTSRMLEELKRRVAPSGRLLLTSSDAGEDAGDTSGSAASPERDIARTVMAGRSTIEFEGAQYVLCEARTAPRLRNRSQFQVVALGEARSVLGRLATREAGTGDEREAFDDAADSLRDSVPYGGEGGLFLLRRLPKSYRPTSDDGPTLTPSQMKPAPKKVDIEIQFVVAGSGRALKDTAFIVTKPDGSETRMMTTSAGSLKLTDLDPGQCVVTSIIDDATMPMSFQPGGADQDDDDDEDDEDDADADGSDDSADGDVAASEDAGGAATGSAAASGSASASASASGGFGLSLSVDALAKGDLAGAIKVTGGLNAQGAASAAKSASASIGGSPGGSAGAQAGAGGAASGGAGGAAAPGGGAAPAGKPKKDKSPIGPASVVEVDRHKVATGETPDSIAADAGVSWDAITQFNFGTTDPDEVQDFLRDRVGCTEMSPDGQSYVFDDDDEPGILLIPRPWTGSFATDDVHKVRMAPVGALYISLENEDGVALPGATYQITFADQSQREGTLGSSGVARLDNVPEGPFAVSYPDRVDMLARSLAASTRKAFDDQATGPLFYLLGQEQDVVDRAVAIYEEYFDDLTGEGFAADIDQVVTDPDARPPLVFLCKLAGIGIEGTEGVIVEAGFDDVLQGDSSAESGDDDSGDDGSSDDDSSDDDSESDDDSSDGEVAENE